MPRRRNNDSEKHMDFLPLFVSNGLSHRFLTRLMCQCYDRADISSHLHVTMGQLKSLQLKRAEAKEEMTESATE